MPSSMNWVDGAAGGTPVSAANLNKLAVTADVGTAGTPTGDALRAAFVPHGATLVNVKDYGAVGNGVANDTTAIQAALSAANVPNGMGIVFLPGGIYHVTSTITIPPGILLQGVGTSDPGGHPGTKIDGAGVVSGPVLQTTDFWHAGGINRIRVDNGPSHGIHITAGMGETAYIDLVGVYYNGGDGVRIEGPSTPMHLGHISPHGNGGAGLRLVNQALTHCQVLYVGGDNNIGGLVAVETLSSSSSVHIMGWKAERSTNGGRPVGHDVIFDLSNLNGGFVNIGQGHIVQTSGGGGGTAVVRQSVTSGSTVGRVQFRFSYNNGSGGADYTNGYLDTANSSSMTLAQASRNTVSVREPRVVFDGTVASSTFTKHADGTGLYYCSATPNGLVTAPPGSVALRTNGAAYLKASGTGSAGWVTIPAVTMAAAPRSTKYLYPAGGQANSSTPVAGQLRYAPLFVPSPCTVTEIGLEITAAGTAGATVRLGLWADDGSGFPTGSPLIDSGAVAATTTGYQSAAASVVLPAGAYWVGAVNQGAPTTNAQWRIISGMVPGVVGFATAGANNAGYQDSVTVTGALGSPSISGNVGGPMVTLKVQ